MIAKAEELQPKRNSNEIARVRINDFENDYKKRSFSE